MNRLVLTGSYNKGVAFMTGSVLSAIVLEQLLISWKENGRSIFSIFIKPCDNKGYVTGNSWKEKTGMSAEDLKYALSLIATRINEKNKRDVILNDIRPNFDTKGKMTNTNHLVIYSTRNGVTYYEINEELSENAISLFFSGEWRNYIAPEPLQRPEKKGITEEEAEEISSFSNLIIPPDKEGENDGE